MGENHNTTMTLDQLSAAYIQIQNQFEKSQAQLAGLHNELAATRNELIVTKSTLHNSSSSSVRPQKPDSFNGKGSVRSWIVHLSNYIGSEQDPHALSVAVSYL